MRGQIADVTHWIERLSEVGRQTRRLQEGRDFLGQRGLPNTVPLPKDALKNPATEGC
jgi:hypothetical protein